MSTQSIDNNSNVALGQGSPANVAAQRPDSEAIQAWLISHLAEALKIDAGELDPREPFANYGMSSMTAVTLSGDLEDWIGLPTAPTVMWDYPSIGALAEHLAATLQETNGAAR